jgi:type I restriction enzyme R subunit
VNRPYEDDAGRRKPSGFVLDFVGIFDNLEKALAFDSQDVEGVIEGIDVLRSDFEQRMATARRDYLAIIAGKTGDKEAEAALDHFRDKDLRQRFYKFFRELQDIYEILSPDTFLRPFLEDYQRLSAMFYLLKAAYDRRSPVDKEFQRKTAALVQKHTESGAIQSPTDMKAITPDLLEAISGGDQPDTVKVFNLLKVLASLIDQQGAVQLYLISIGERAQKIAEAFETRQITSKQALEALDAITAKIKQAGDERSAMGLSERAYAVYMVLQDEEGIVEPREAASKMDQAFETYPHWTISEQGERAVRTQLYKSLAGSGAKPNRLSEIVARVLNLIRRATA